MHAAVGGDAVNAAAQTAKQAPADDYPGLWDQAAFAFPEFLAVKKNVVVRVDAGWTAKIGQKFAAKAMEKI